MKTIFFIHFHPIEKFPPAFNLLRLLGNEKNGSTHIILTTTAPENKINEMVIPGVTIYRTRKGKKGMSRLARALLYVRFNVKAFALLIWNRPATIFYYETLSAGAAWLYMRLNWVACRLFIHYHEYNTPEEYKNGMALNRWLHLRERFLYTKSEWVSQTNDVRLRLFLNDCGKFCPLHSFVLPNYPPALWKNKAMEQKKTDTKKIGFVYVGALDTKTMYLTEMADLITSHPDDSYWDIYSDNYSDGAMALLKSLSAPNIFFKGAISYDKLPQVLPCYQVGVILYKGHLPNYIFNAPNKLFEYAVCGIDVWFPKEMKGTLPYTTTDTNPKIIALDFESLNDIDIRKLTDHSLSGGTVSNRFSCENVFQPLLKELFN